MGDVTKATILEVIDEVVDALGRASVQFKREIELIVRADGTASLMGGDAAGTSFEEIRKFASMSDVVWWMADMASGE